MANNVFANGREISCKSGSGKSIASFPDVCMTPPENPATPPGVPVPYPNTGMTGDCTSGSTTVKITNKEAMLKNKSYFKKSTGDEAGAAAKKGVVSSKNRGKVYFTMWSMDVKIEGENAVRHLDMTTHNHGSAMNTPPWPFADSMAIKNGKTKDPCDKEKKAEKSACKGLNSKSAKCKSKKCRDAMACKLVAKKNDKKQCCAPNNTGHHLVEVHCFSATALRGHPLEGTEAYHENKAPTVCTNRSASKGKHKLMHSVQRKAEASFAKKPVLAEWIDPDGKGRTNVSKWRYKHARDAGAKAMKTAHPQCSEKCTKAQLNQYHKSEAGVGENTPMRSDTRVFPK